VCESGLVVCYSREGQPRWTFDLQDYAGPASSPLIANDGTIYIGNYFTGMYALRPDGSQKWAYPEVVSGPPAEGLDGSIYYPSNSRLIALSPDGVRLWAHATHQSYGFGSAPAVGDDGVIYVTRHPGRTARGQSERYAKMADG
jgi:outer membrane protein assembly factor BamB